MLGLPENWTSDFTSKLGMREHHEKDPSDYVIYLQGITMDDYNVIFHYQCEGELIKVYEPVKWIDEILRERVIDGYKDRMGL